MLIDAYSGGAMAYDTEYWKDRSFDPELHNLVDADIPMYQIDGTWDLYQEGALRNYSQLQNLAAGRPQYGPMPPARHADGRFQLLDGPWYHVEIGAGPGSRIDTDRIALAWFDRWLKNIPNGVDKTDRPLHMISADNMATDTASYPFQQASVRRMYLNGDRLTDRAGHDAAGPNELCRLRRPVQPGEPLAVHRRTAGLRLPRVPGHRPVQRT